MTFPKPKNPILAFLFHPALPAGVVVFFAYYFLLRRYFATHPTATRVVEDWTASDPAFYCWALLLASTILFADVFAFLATLGGPNVARGKIDDVRTLNRKLNRSFIKGWLFGLSVYLTCAGVAFYILNRAFPEAGRITKTAAGLEQMEERYGIYIIIAYVVLAIVLLFILPKRLSNLIIEKGWSKGFYRVAAGFALVAFVLLSLSIIKGQPYLFRKIF